ncbi:hypothetical protein P8452_25616 [Trifolium repens]|nr:hypothetical protein P8452_25616 [Trifolium repens]
MQLEKLFSSQHSADIYQIFRIVHMLIHVRSGDPMTRYWIVGGRDAWFGGDAQLEVVHAAAARDRNDNEEDRNEIGTMKKKMNAPIVLFTIPNTDHLVSAF